MIFGFDLGPGRLLVGAFTGATYGLLAIGLIITYRASRFLNLAHAAIGVLGAAVVSLTCRQLGVAYWIALPLGVLTGAATAAAIEILLIRRLVRASRLTAMIVTLGLAQLLVLVALLVDRRATSGYTFPRPPGLPTFTVGGVQFSGVHIAMMVAVPVLLAGLAVFLRRSRFGLAIRAAADNPALASLVGAKPVRLTSLAWIIAGAVAALSAILIAPTQGVQTIETLGPGLLLRALAAGVIAQMRSLPIAFGAAVGLGVVEQVVLSRAGSAGVVELVVAGICALALLAQPRLVERSIDVAPTEQAVVLKAPRWTYPVTAITLAGLAALLSATATNSVNAVAISVVGWAMVGLSVVVVTGLAGEMSLGQFAFAGIAATASALVAGATGSSAAAIVVGVGVGAVTATLVGLPAVRLRGVALAVSTLALALTTGTFVLRQPWLLGDGRNPGAPTMFGVGFDSPRAYTLLAVALLLVAMVATANLRRSGWGRILVAIRDNKASAQALGVMTTTRTLQAYAIAGGLAGLGGVVIGHAQTWLTAATFPVSAGIDVVAVAVIGGIGSVIGPILGATILVGIPGMATMDETGRALLTVGWLILAVIVPQGLAGAIAQRTAARRAPARASAPRVGQLELPPAHRGRAPGALVEVRNVTKRYGGVPAVTDATLAVYSGEIVGIVGPNGAGKTTLFEIIAGFVKPDHGTVVFQSQPITALTPQARARLGIARSFQDCRLFPTLTVRETLALAADTRTPTRIGPGVLGWMDSERARLAHADGLMTALGLSTIAEHRVDTLSTGSRRLVELGALLACRPEVLLLDEPSAGLGPAEREPLGDLLRTIHRELGIALVIVEHDLALLTGLATRLIAMDLGRVVAAGAPQDVLADPVVARAYLGAR